LTKDTCPRCGSVVQPGASRCGFCGAELRAAPQNAGDASVVSASAAYGATPTAPQSFAAPVPASSPPAPGVYPYPTYPQYQAPYGYAYPYPSSYGVYAPYGYYGYYGYYPTMYAKPQRAPGETYALVVSWIVTALSGISILLGLGAALFGLISLALGTDVGLAGWGAFMDYIFAPLAGGAIGLWFGIRGILRRVSPRFQLPPAWATLGLLILALVASVGIWALEFQLGRSAGASIAVLPLAFLAGALPALTILAFVTQRLGDPSTRRHVWMSLAYGATLAPLIAGILEFILQYVIAFALGLNSSQTQQILSNTGAPSGPVLLATLLLLSVVAPLVEETLKPLGAALIIRRLRTPGEAFLVGLAGGVGFDMAETIGYITLGQSDWITVAIERIGAGLLHGLGAGMCGLGWYYLVNGKGVPLRWLRAIGCFAYAVFQHGTFNALTLVNSASFISSDVKDWFNQPFDLGPLPLAHIDIFFFVVYALILTMLVVMTFRLRNAKGMAPLPQPQPQWPAGGYPYPVPYAPYGGYTPYAAYPAIPWGYGLTQQSPASMPQAAPMPEAPQTPGGAQ
jgi:RsiW-degrading membrane proteinase PrsW (M82 family)